jgi:hypothetical protein
MELICSSATAVDFQQATGDVSPKTPLIIPNSVRDSNPVQIEDILKKLLRIFIPKNDGIICLR